MKKILILLCIVAYWACNNDDESHVVKPEVSFSEFTDPRDGQVYKCVTIGGQTWMAENLAYRMPQGSFAGCFTYKEEEIDTARIVVPAELFKTALLEALDRGDFTESYYYFIKDFYAADILREVLANTYTTANAIIAAFESDDVGRYMTETPKQMNGILSSLKPAVIVDVAAKAYAESEFQNGNYATENGLLYTFEAAKLAAPAGWRLPTDEDWKKLEETLGMPLSEIEKLDIWRGCEEGSVLKTGQDGCGFDILFSGARLYGHWPQGTPYRDKGHRAYFWSSSQHVENDTTHLGITRIFSVDRNQILRGTSMPEAAYSVRLIKE